MGRSIKVAFAGGGTGGHVFPALNMADAIQKEYNAEIIFFGTERGLENRKVPERGYQLIQIPVAGFQRKLTLRNVSFPWKLYRSMQICKTKLKDFKPDLVIGSGGYVMGPVLKSAQKLGIPTILQEQNSYPGVTTRLLAKKADLIFLAYERAKDFLQTSARIMVTGNPLSLKSITESKADLFAQFKLDPRKNVLLVFGGSQGAANINLALMHYLKINKLPEHYQMLWQTGHAEIEAIDVFLKSEQLTDVQALPFIDGMERAYAITDLVICRAGAMTLSELMAAGLPAILIPYPHAAADHQYKNAQALADAEAAIIIRDDQELSSKLESVLPSLLEDDSRQNNMAAKMAALHKTDTIPQMTAAIKQLLEERAV